MDDADRAQRLIERERSACVEAARVPPVPEAPLMVGSLRLCRECGTVLIVSAVMQKSPTVVNEFSPTLL